MRRPDKLIFAAAIAVIIAMVTYGVVRILSIKTVTGAVLRDDPIPANQLTIANAEISVSDGGADGIAKSDATGYFQVKLARRVRNGETISIQVQHSSYRPREVKVAAANRLYVIRMTPAAGPTTASPNAVAISDVRLRYAVRSVRTENVGSLVKVFEVANTGDVPCGSKGPCSPDGKWQAAIGGASLDAGDDNEFRDARVYCIAGPCPFTRIEKDSFSRGGRQIGVEVRDWSDSVSFVIEAQVMHTMSGDTILQSYPVIFNQTATFTLPPRAQGPSIEATIDHQEIVYPLGPKPKLSWADCDIQTRKDLTKLYRCVLKPGYRFQ